jgi:UDP-N-acetylmuramyl-tripeptide synthetase
MTARHAASVADAVLFLRERGATAVRSDSRLVQPGEAFVAVPGQLQDGRRFVAAALAAGAVACVVEAQGAEAFALDDPRVIRVTGLKATAGTLAAAVLDHPSARLDLLATTGTNGKTSTAWWAAQALTQLGRRCGFIGTLGVGEPGEALVSTGLTTPDAVALQSALADFAGRGFAACAIEASSIGLAEHRMAGTQVAVAMFTNLTQDHLDYHGSMQAYGEAKRRLFAWPTLRGAALNVDDAFGADLATDLRSTGLPLWTVSVQGLARLRAEHLRYEGTGLAFDVVEDGVAVPVHSQVVGDYNVSNLLVVMGALRALGLPLADIAAVIPQLTPVPGRLEAVAAGSAQEPVVLVDYAHTPDALQQVLQALRPMAHARQGRLWCVFGCGGNRDAGKRPLMGAIAARLADRVVLTSDNPRLESPGAILAQILAGASAEADVRAVVCTVEDRALAITQAVLQAAAADVVLLAGKGHEDYQDLAGERRPFRDAEVALRALRSRAQEAVA